MKQRDESQVRLIPIDRIRVVNPRVRDQVKFGKVVESIGKLGLKKPITVTPGEPTPDGRETFDLVCGQGRLEAFQRLGQTEIPALVRGLSKPESLLASLIENIARRRVRGLDQIKMIQWMKEQGHPYGDIARRTGLSEDYVQDILNMLRNGEERLLEAVLNGKIPVTIAVKISESSDEQAQRVLMSAMERRERIDEINGVFVALPRHQNLEELVMSTIRQAALAFPLTERFLEETVNPSNLAADARKKCSRRSVGAGSVFGGVGGGKTESVVQILMACPQTILHSNFNGRALGFTQISWMYISMPPKASAFGFLLMIAGVLDLILKTSYWSEVMNARNHAEATAIVVSRLNLNAVGAVFCDELQNIKVGSRTERDLLENTIQELVNLTHTRFVFIGTDESRNAVNSEALHRRMVGERGQLSWGPLKWGPDWDDFIKAVWQWLVTKVPTPLTPGLSALLHRLTGGVPDYAKKLITTTQAVVIGDEKKPEEQMSEALFVKVMRSRFPKIHRDLERRYMRDTPKAAPLP